MSKKGIFRGVQQNQEIDPINTWRDTRTTWQKLSDYIADPSGFITIMGGIIGCFIIFPAFGMLWALIGFYILWAASQKEFRLPFRIPKTSGLMDPGQPNPANDKPSQSEGITFFGNERNTQKELWFNNSDMRTHVLIFGSTGAGKALRDDELVHTPKGWIKNKCLKIGDTVSTHNGTSKIIGIYPQGKLKLYKISFEDSREILVSGDHLWEVHNHGWEPNVVGDGILAKARVLPTWKIKQILENKDDNLSLYIPLIKKLEKPIRKHEIGFTELVARIKNYSFDLEQEDFNELNTQVLFEAFRVYAESSWEDRKNLSQSILLSYGKKSNNCILFRFNNQLVLKTIRDLFFSLGEIVFTKGNELTVIEEKNPQNDKFLKISSVVETDAEESCQCIKLADKRGLFVTKDYLVTHNTETLLSLAYNALVQGSGLIYVDGKGENVLYTKVFAMARTMGREDDVLCINYMTGARDVFGPQEKKLSNTLNPFSSGGSGGLTELIVSLMDDGGSGGSGDMWKGRAISLISAIMMALVYMRDEKEILLDVEVIRDYLILDNIIKLYKTRKDFPKHIRDALRAYLVSLPGFQESSPKQNDTVLEQHGYLQMQFTKLLGSLSDQYGFIFKTNLGEVDFKDVVLNRRILVVLLPALEKSTDELANLGKIIVACLKQMMAAALGATVEGTYADVVETKPTNSDMPFMTILDEYGYYAVKGSAVMPAQARSLGFSMIFAGQDLPAFKKASEEEAASIVANCNIKICMKLEDPKETYELFEKAAAEALVSSVGNYDLDSGGMASSYIPGRSASVKTEKRINMLDLREQREGEAHIIFKSAVIRAKMFYAAPPKPSYISMNYFVRVEPPDQEVVDKMDASKNNLIKAITDEVKIKEIEDFTSEDNNNLIKKMFIEWSNLKDVSKQERSSRAVYKICNELHGVYDEKLSGFKKQVDLLNEELDEELDEEIDEEIDIFLNKKKSKGDMSSSKDGEENEDYPFLDEEETKKQIDQIEQLMSGSDKGDNNGSENYTRDMHEISKYPSYARPEQKDPQEIIELLSELEEIFKKNDGD